MDPIMVAGLVFGVIFTAALYPACRAKGQSPWWCLLGMIGLIGVGLCMLVLFVWKPRKQTSDTTDLRKLYAAGQISEQEYLEAMTRGDRAA
jgi:hypothetical protein